MSNPWFRLYHEFATDPKIQMMPEEYQRRFIMLLCLRCSNGDVTLHDTEVAFQLRISNEEWGETKAVLLQKNLINDDNKPVAWDKRQFVSDSSAERVRKHREKKKQGCNVTVTTPDTDTDTDTDKKKKEKKEKVEVSPVQPDGLNTVAWKQYIEHRKNINARKLKPVSEEKSMRWLVEQGNHIKQQAIVEQTIRNGWTGLFELKAGAGNKSSGAGIDYLKQQAGVMQ